MPTVPQSTIKLSNGHATDMKNNLLWMPAYTVVCFFVLKYMYFCQAPRHENFFVENLTWQHIQKHGSSSIRNRGHLTFHFHCAAVLIQEEVTIRRAVTNFHQGCGLDMRYCKAVALLYNICMHVTRKRFWLKMQTFLYGCAFRLYENGENVHENIFTLKTLSKMETLLKS